MIFLGDKYLKWDELAKISRENAIFVNTNRLLWLFSELFQKEEYNKMKILEKQVSEMCDNKKMYITMQVGEILECGMKQIYR